MNKSSEKGILATILRLVFGVEQNNDGIKADKLAGLLKEAHSSIWAVCGNINGELWMSEAVVTALQNASDYLPHGGIRLIVDKLKKPKSEVLLQLWQDGKIHINYYPYPLLGHYTVIDGVSVRIESMHAPETTAKTASIIRSSNVLTKLPGYMLGKRLSADFIELLSYTKPLADALPEDVSEFELS